MVDRLMAIRYLARGERDEPSSGPDVRGERNMGQTPRTAFLIGAQKSATTFLADLLSRHPDICLSVPKEPDYFTVHRDAPLSRYGDFFPHKDRALRLDASTSYSAAPSRPEERTADNPRHGVPERILKAIGKEARFLYVLRPPVERVWSGYWHDRRLGIERRGFLEAIESNSWYLDISRYAMQIAEYDACFPEEAILVLNQKELVGAPAATLARCISHLGLPDADIPVSTDRKNSSYSYNRGGLALRSLAGGSRGLKSATRLARRLLPRRAVDGLRAMLTRPIPPMPESERRHVEDILREDMTRLRERTGIDFLGPS